MVAHQTQIIVRATATPDPEIPETAPIEHACNRIARGSRAVAMTLADDQTAKVPSHGRDCAARATDRRRSHGLDV